MPRIILDADTREVLKGAAVAFSMKAVGAGCQFLFNIALARFLGADGTGIYYLALLALMIASVISRLGLDNVLLRLVAARSHRNDWVGVSEAYSLTLRLAFVASVVASGILFVFAPMLARDVFNEARLVVPLRLMSVAVVPLVFATLHAQALKGLKRIGDAVFVEGFSIPLVALLIMLIVRDRVGEVGGVAAYVVAAVVAAVFGLVVWRRRVPRVARVRNSLTRADILHSSLPLFWVASISLAMTWAPSFFLGAWWSVEEVGIYNVAARTALLITFVLFAVNSVAAPKFAALYAENDLEGLRAIVTMATRIMVLATAPLLLVFVLVPEFVLGFFGTEFEERGVGVLVILALGQFINVSTGSVGYLLMMTGRERLMRNITVIAATIAIVLNVVLVPGYGSVGAAVATSSGLALLNLIAALVAWSRLRIWTLPVGGRLVALLGRTSDAKAT